MNLLDELEDLRWNAINTAGNPTTAENFDETESDDPIPPRLVLHSLTMDTYREQKTQNDKSDSVQHDD